MIGFDYSQIRKIPFKGYTWKGNAPKKAVCMHGTASGDGIEGDLSHFEKLKNVSTPIVIERNGQINQLYWSGFSAYHLGAGKRLEEITIGFEYDTWLALTMHYDKFYPINYVNKVRSIDQKDVCHYDAGHRGYIHYERLTDAQLESARKLLLLWRAAYDIDTTYHDDIFDISPRALRGESGVFTHCAYREDKLDLPPQLELIQMLKSL